MFDEAYIQGRRVNAEDLQQIRVLLLEQPTWNRTLLSRQLCHLWGWHTESGQPKDMACRTLLLKLQARQLITLPVRQGPSVNGSRNRKPVEVPHDDSPLATGLEALQPLRVEPVSTGSPEATLLRWLLHRYHYLSHYNCVGENLKYLVRADNGRPLACLLFGSAAWACAARDGWIGWDPSVRQRNLRYLTNNTRFLVMPWIQVPCLASHLLGLITRRLSRDWQEKYGHPIHAVETFVECDRFRATCYRAAGWVCVGRTTGRGRNARSAVPQRSAKEIFLKPLHPKGREPLFNP